MNDQVDIEERTQTLRGPGLLKLTLDADQIYPDEPGLGTPILFEWDGETRETMTWCCGYEGGNLGEIVPEKYHDVMWQWVNGIAEDVAAWEDHWWDRRTSWGV